MFYLPCLQHVRYHENLIAKLSQWTNNYWFFPIWRCAFSFATEFSNAILIALIVDVEWWFSYCIKTLSNIQTNRIDFQWIKIEWNEVKWNSPVTVVAVDRPCCDDTWRHALTVMTFEHDYFDVYLYLRVLQLCLKCHHSSPKKCHPRIESKQAKSQHFE